MLLPILRAATHTVRDTHAIGSVADDNLGMFGITEMAMKNADAPLPGAPHHRNSKQGEEPRSLRGRISGSKGPLSEPTRVAPPWWPEPLLMPLFRHWRV